MICVYSVLDITTPSGVYTVWCVFVWTVYYRSLLGGRTVVVLLQRHAFCVTHTAAPPPPPPPPHARYPIPPDKRRAGARVHARSDVYEHSVDVVVPCAIHSPYRLLLYAAFPTTAPVVSPPVPFGPLLITPIAFPHAHTTTPRYPLPTFALFFHRRPAHTPAPPPGALFLFVLLPVASHRYELPAHLPTPSPSVNATGSVWLAPT